MIGKVSAVVDGFECGTIFRITAILYYIFIFNSLWKKITSTPDPYNIIFSCKQTFTFQLSKCYLYLQIYNWEPKYLNPENLPEMPEELNTLIQKYHNNEDTRNMTQQIWITCEGESPVDKENIVGFNYYPTQGFPNYFYPYTNAKGYLSPLVAVQVLQPTRKWNYYTTLM